MRPMITLSSIPKSGGKGCQTFSTLYDDARKVFEGKNAADGGGCFDLLLGQVEHKDNCRLGAEPVNKDEKTAEIIGNRAFTKGLAS